MFHKFINSNGTQEFLFMIAIAETLHILDRIWLPVKVEHTPADFSSSLFLFGSMLLMMKYISTIQDLKNSIQNMVLNAILFYAQVIATLIIWSVLHKWINAIFTNESIGYSCCLILSAALVYCGLTVWIPDCLPNQHTWRRLKFEASRMSLGLGQSSSEIINRIWKKPCPLRCAPKRMRR